MKYLLLFFVGVFLASCGTRIAYTNAVRDEFELTTELKLKKVQFMVSSDIILQRSSESGDQGTDEQGTLVSSSSREQDRVIIPNGTKGVFEGFDENGAMIVRFEQGQGKTLTFMMRNNNNENSKYFIGAEWDGKKGGKIEYGNREYYATTASGAVYLMVLKKKLQKTKRKDRVVKGMKV